MSIARRLYSALWWLATPAIAAYLLYRSLRQPDYRRHWGERLGRYPAPRTRRPLIWIHAVSVGETRAAQTLAEALLERFPGYDLLLTHMTPTGRAVPMKLDAARLTRAYLAYDYKFAVERFLAHFRPCIGILMETELWPNLIAAAGRSGVPLVLVNARLSERSWRRTTRFPALARPAIASLAAILAQSDADAARFRSLGAKAVSVMGNLKFDAEVSDADLALGEEFRAREGARPVFLCASTREGEEALILDAWSAARVPAETLLVIVPRHPQRFEEVAALVRARGLALQRRSDAAPVAAETRVWLGDSMGELLAYYRAAQVCYVGGGLLPFGTHNLIEACAVGCPVLLGPHTYNFAEAAAGAIEAGAAQSVSDAAGLMEAAGRLLVDDGLRAASSQAAIRFAERHRGATLRAATQIANLIERAKPND